MDERLKEVNSSEQRFVVVAFVQIASKNLEWLRISYSLYELILSVWIFSNLVSFLLQQGVARRSSSHPKLTLHVTNCRLNRCWPRYENNPSRSAIIFALLKQKTIFRSGAVCCFFESSSTDFLARDNERLVISLGFEEKHVGFCTKLISKTVLGSNGLNIVTLCFKVFLLITCKVSNLSCVQFWFPCQFRKCHSQWSKLPSWNYSPLYKERKTNLLSSGQCNRVIYFWGELIGYAPSRPYSWVSFVKPPNPSPGLNAPRNQKPERKILVCLSHAHALCGVQSF